MQKGLMPIYNALLAKFQRQMSTNWAICQYDIYDK